MLYHPRFIARLLGRPQLIEPGAGAAVLRALMPSAHLEGWYGEPSDVVRDPRDYGIANSTAVIPIVGELVHRGALMDAASGLTSYQGLADMVSEAIADPNVRGILLDIDSPGGEAAGVLDLSEWIAAQRGTKPIVAHVNEQACSAAYAIASGAERIVLGPSGMVGSIGVVAYHTDVSAALDKQGVKVTYISAGAHKTDGVMTRPLSTGAQQRMQEMVNNMHQRFCDVVARNRGISSRSVADTEAGILLGREALAAGLADEIRTQEQALSELSQRRAVTGSRLITQATGPALQAQQPANPPSPAGPQPPQPQPVAPPTPPPTPPTPPPAEPTPTPPPTQPERGPGVVPGSQNDPLRTPDRDLPTEEDLADMPAEEAEKIQRKNSPQSPVPAKPQQIAQACAAAGYADLILPLMQSAATMAEVSSRISDARTINDACVRAGMAQLAPTLIKSGLTVEAAREVLFAAKASEDDGVRTDSSFGRGDGAEAHKRKAPLTIAEGQAASRLFGQSLARKQ
jgi:signal peptide peptidase SppA